MVSKLQKIVAGILIPLALLSKPDYSLASESSLYENRKVAEEIKRFPDKTSESNGSKCYTKSVTVAGKNLFFTYCDFNKNGNVDFGDEIEFQSEDQKDYVLCKDEKLDGFNFFIDDKSYLGNSGLDFCYVEKKGELLIDYAVSKYINRLITSEKLESERIKASNFLTKTLNEVYDVLNSDSLQKRLEESKKFNSAVEK
jgi:hypothetical protein